MPKSAQELLELLPKTDKVEYWEHARWYVLSLRDGEHPVLQDVSTPDEVAVILQELDGKDVFVWVFHGLPVQFTRKPHRYLLLPGSADLPQAIPLFDVAALGIPDQFSPNGIDLTVQEDGFMGSPELTLSAPPGKFLREKDKPLPKNGTELYDYQGRPPNRLPFEPSDEDDETDSGDDDE